MSELLNFPKTTLTPTSAIFGADIEIGEWAQVGRALCEINQCSQWWVGDWVNCGERTYQKNKEALSFFGKEILGDQFGYALKTIKDYAYVCRSVLPSMRIDGLSFGHHQVVAPLCGEDQAKWLRAALAGDNGFKWTVGKLREAIRGAHKTVENEPSDPCPTITKYMTEAVCWLGNEDKKEPIEKWGKERCELVLMSVQKIDPFKERLVDRIRSIDER